jgi:hypothetical protein
MRSTFLFFTSRAFVANAIPSLTRPRFPSRTCRQNREPIHSLPVTTPRSAFATTTLRLTAWKSSAPSPPSTSGSFASREPGDSQSPLDRSETCSKKHRRASSMRPPARVRSRPAFRMRRSPLDTADRHRLRHTNLRRLIRRQNTLSSFWDLGWQPAVGTTVRPFLRPSLPLLFRPQTQLQRSRFEGSRPRLTHKTR